MKPVFVTLLANIIISVVLVSLKDNTFCCKLLTARIYDSALSYTHTHLFNGPFSGTTRVGQYQKGKTNLDFTEARDSE